MKAIKSYQVVTNLSRLRFSDNFNFNLYKKTLKRKPEANIHVVLITSCKTKILFK